MPSYSGGPPRFLVRSLDPLCLPNFCVCSSHQHLLLKLAKSTCAWAGQLEHRLPLLWPQVLAQIEEALMWAVFRPGTHTAGRGFGEVGSQTQEPSRLTIPWTSREDTGLRGGRACSAFCPCHCPRRSGWRLEKGTAMVALSPACHSTMAPHILGSPGLLHKPSQQWSPSLLLPQAISSLPTAVPSLGPLSKPHFPARNPPPHQETHNSGWGIQGCGMDHVHQSHSVLPSIEQLLYSPPIPWTPWRFPSVTADPFAMIDLLWMWEPPLSSRSPQGCQSCPTPTPFPPVFPSLILLVCGQTPPVSLCLRSSTSAWQVLYKNHSNALVRRCELHVLLFCHLDSYFILFNGWVIIHCIYVPHLLYPFICW